MAVFTITRKENEKNLKLRTLQGMILVQLLRRLHPFDPLSVLFWLCWLYFCSFSIFYSALSTWPRFISRLPVGTLTKRDSHSNPFLAHAVGHTFQRVCLRIEFHHLFTSRNNTSCYPLQSFPCTFCGPHILNCEFILASNPFIYIQCLHERRRYDL